MGIGEASIMAWRIPGMSPPVERSMAVSAPYWIAERSFSNSSPTFETTDELPMLALILQREAIPMAIGSRFG